MKLHEKAQASFANARQYVPSSRLTGLRSSDRDDEDGDDELSVFAGRARLVETRHVPAPAPQGARSQSYHAMEGMHMQPPPTYASSSSLSSSPSFSPFIPEYPATRVSSSASSGTDPNSYPTMSAAGVRAGTAADPTLNSFDNVHPSLVDQLHRFDGRLAAQMAGSTSVDGIDKYYQSGGLFPSSSSSSSSLSGGHHHTQQQQYVVGLQHTSTMSYDQSTQLGGPTRSNTSLQDLVLPGHDYISPASLGVGMDAQSANQNQVQQQQQRQAQALLSKTGSMPETWSSFVQQLDMPSPPIYGSR